jgi:hypothetical protein
VILASQVEENARIEALNYLKRVARRQGPGASQWRCEAMISDSAAEGIVEFARREKVDLIAMYTHNRKGLAKLLKGSVASAVQKAAPTEVRLFTGSEMEAEGEGAAPRPAETPAPTAGTVEAVLRAADIFKGLSRDQIAKMVPMARRVNVASGQALGKAGEAGDHLFIIAQGEAQITAHTEVGDIAIRVAAPGNSFPVFVLIRSGNLLTSGRALTDMEVLELPRSELLDLCTQNPSIGVRVYMNLSEILAERYGSTLGHLARSVERELADTDGVPTNT